MQLSNFWCEWISHLGIDNRKFPRDLAFPQRIKAYNFDDFNFILEDRILISDCYVACYSDEMIDNQEIDKLYLDVDSKDLNEAHKRMQTLNDYLQQRYDCKPRIYFSAAKGFSIYPDFNIIRLKAVSSIKQFMMQLMNETGIPLDHTFDLRRVSRLPYSKNFNNYRSGQPIKLCIPIEPTWTLHKIISESKLCTFSKFVELNPADYFREEFVVFDEANSEREQKAEIERAKHAKPITINMDKLDRSLQALVEIAHLIKKSGKAELFDGRHRILNLHIIPTLVQKQWTDDSILQFCKQWLELTGKDPSFYLYELRANLNRTREGKWLPWSIERLCLRYPELFEVFENWKTKYV